MEKKKTTQQLDPLPVQCADGNDNVNKAEALCTAMYTPINSSYVSAHKLSLSVVIQYTISCRKDLLFIENM